MGTKAIRFTESELATLEALVVAAGETDPGNEGLQALWLKVTGRKPAPKAKAPAALTPNETADAVAALDKCVTRDGARKLLSWYKVAQLRCISKAITGGMQSKLRKDELVDSLIHFTVGARLDHAAIMGSFKR